MKKNPIRRRLADRSKIQVVPEFHEIRIENTNACGYRCVMCPREKQTRDLGYMSLDDFEIVLDRVGPYCGHVHLHGFGEPLLDRALVKKLERLKARWPKCGSTIFSTLGTRISDFGALVRSGLDCLNISLYGFTREGYAKVHGIDAFDRVKENLTQLSRAIGEAQSAMQVCIKLPSPNLSSSLPVAFPEEMMPFCRWLQSLGFRLAMLPVVHNYGNGRSYNKPASEILCPVIEGLRSKILNVTWDLNVIPCCFDFNASIRFGNLRKESLKEIFSSPEYLRFVIAHRSKTEGIYPVCATCEKNDCRS